MNLRHILVIACAFALCTCLPTVEESEAAPDSQIDLTRRSYLPADVLINYEILAFNSGFRRKRSVEIDAADPRFIAEIVNGVGDLVGNTVGAIVSPIWNVVGVVFAPLGNILEVVSTVLGFIFNPVQSIIAVIVDILGAIVGPVNALLKSILDEILNSVYPAVGAVILSPLRALLIWVIDVIIPV